MWGQGLLARVRATGRLWNTALVVIDIAVVALATYAAYLARFEGSPPEPFARWIGPLAVGAAVLYVAAFALAGLYRLVLRYVGVDTLLRLLGAVVATAALLLVADLAMPLVDDVRPVPLGVLFFQALLVFLGSSGARLAARVFLYLRAVGASDGRRVLIVGAGSAGSLLLREIQARPDLGLTAVGFLDDDPALTGKTLSGVTVLGTSEDLAGVAARLGVEEIVVALPSAPRERIRALLNAAADLGIETRVMPPLVIAKGSVSLRDLRPVEVEDLLGREPTPIDVEQVRETVAGKVVAVTGAAGSIGAELCRQIATLGPKRLLLLEVDETRLYELWLELETCAPAVAEMHICDIRDAAKLDALFAEHRPELVLHAAAYKHVPLMELEPAEAVKTNVGGTRNVIEACERHGIERFVLISTDKAVAPANTMGLTKQLAERVMLDATRCCDLNAVAVRFGNVLASRGSVVPIFEEQLRHGGPLTVTHPEVTRYFMTIPEAARLVLQAQAIGSAGDIFVLEMGEPVKIADLARKMIALAGVPANIEFVGLRPGEKLHEVLVSEAERLVPTGREKILRVERTSVPDERFAERVSALLGAADAADDIAIRALLALEADGGAPSQEV
ncbi:MAG: nucleoside-diphosphate sugar epimerase/dehydratase [Coriobacteriia bacterium]|nr:nucleoside-diphosphate sugar epimerase/dehydratase [Coriobacteriia bacterium]